MILETEPGVELTVPCYPETANEARVVFYAFLASNGNDQQLNRLAKAAQKILKQEALNELGNPTKLWKG